MNTNQRPEDTSDPSPEAEASQAEAAAPEVEASQPKTAPPHTPEAETSEQEAEAQPAPEEEAQPEPEAEVSEPEAAEPEADAQPAQEAEASEPEAAVPPHLAEASVTTEPGLSKDSLNMGMLCHLLAFCGIVAPGVGNILGPLILWLIKKDEDPYVDKQGKESVNFQISVTIYSIVCIILIFTIILAPIAGILLTVIGLAALVLTIIGTIKASKGEPWKYPLTIRMIK